MLFGSGSMSMPVLVEKNIRNKWSIVKEFYNLKGGFACLHLCDVWMEQKALLWCIINYTKSDDNYVDLLQSTLWMTVSVSSVLKFLFIVHIIFP